MIKQKNVACGLDVVKFFPAEAAGGLKMINSLASVYKGVRFLPTGGITPDNVTFAKGVAGGFPMGGMISFGGKLSALFTPGSHGSTFAGNPLCAAAARR